MKKTLVVALISAGLFVGNAPATAASPAATKFLKEVKSYKLPQLKKSKDSEIIAVASLWCGGTTYAGYSERVYAENRLKPNAKTGAVLSALAKKYLCAQSIDIVNQDGSWTTVKVYTGKPNVVWSEVETSVNNDISKKLADAGKVQVP